MICLVHGDVWICFFLILPEALSLELGKLRSKGGNNIHNSHIQLLRVLTRTTARDRTVISTGSILPTRPVVFLLSKCIPLMISTTSRGFLMRESHIEHVLIQIHMPPLKAHSRLGYRLVNA